MAGVSAGTFTNIVYRNTDLAHRQYQALVFQSRYRVQNNWTINGHYTVQLQNDGNYEGEGSNTPGSTTCDRRLPGDLHRAALLPGRASPELPAQPLPPVDHLQHRTWARGAICRSRASGASKARRAYSLAARNQGHDGDAENDPCGRRIPDEPAAAHIFFDDERGTEQFPGYGLLDLSINYNIPVFKSLRPWIKLDLYNVLDNRKLIAFDTTVSQNNAGAKDSVGLATTFNKGANFGKATGNTQTNVSTTGINSFPLAFQGAPAGGRTFRMALGFRF